MKRLMLLTLLLLGFQAQAGEYLVKYSNKSIFNLLSKTSSRTMVAVKVLDHNSTAHLIKVNLPTAQEASLLAQLRAQPGVEYVTPNFKLHAFAAPVRIQDLQQQWAISKIQADKAWVRAGNKGNKKVVVAVVDTGVDYKHESLAPNMVAGYNFKDDNADPMDITSEDNPGHGTHCAGAIAATGLIQGGTIGIAPNVSVMPVRFLGEDGAGDVNDSVKAIDFAVSKNVDVISASWGAAVPREAALPLIEAIKRADDKGIIFVAAAANDGNDNDEIAVYPANVGFANSFSVAASGTADEKPYWTNYGKATVDVASPGDNIMSTLPGNHYGALSGTSMSAPIVAGLVAFLKSQDSTLTGAQIKAIIEKTGDKVDIETACGCRINALSATDAIISKKLILVPTAATVQPKDTLNFSVLHGQGVYTYSSSNPGVATISNAGVLTAVNEGTTVITATGAGGVVTSLDINVRMPSTPPPSPWPAPYPGPGDEGAPVGGVCDMEPYLPMCHN